VREWKRRQVEAAKECERAAEARAKAAAREREITLLVSQSRALAAYINRFVKAALKAVNKESGEKVRLLYNDAGRCALQLHATRNTNLIPVIASLRRARVLLLKILRRPDSATEADPAANSPTPAPASEAHLLPSVSASSVLLSAQEDAGGITAAATPATVAVAAVVGGSGIEADISALRPPGGLGVANPPLGSHTHSAPVVPQLGIVASTLQSVPPPPADSGGRLWSKGGSSLYAAAVILYELLGLARSFGYEGRSGVEHTSDKTFEDGRTVGGGQDVAGLSSLPTGDGRGGKEFLPTRRKLLASTLALPDCWFPSCRRPRNGGDQDVNGSVSLPVEGGRGGREFRPIGWKLLASTLALPDH
jgi:hypothetical protein